jgi:hypothetical protein
LQGCAPNPLLFHSYNVSPKRLLAVLTFSFCTVPHAVSCYPGEGTADNPNWERPWARDRRRLLRPVRPDVIDNICYYYTILENDAVAGIVDHFGLSMQKVRLIMKGRAANRLWNISYDSKIVYFYSVQFSSIQPTILLLMSLLFYCDVLYDLMFINKFEYYFFIIQLLTSRLLRRHHNYFCLCNAMVTIFTRVRLCCDKLW